MYPVVTQTAFYLICLHVLDLVFRRFEMLFINKSDSPQKVFNMRFFLTSFSTLPIKSQATTIIIIIIPKPLTTNNTSPHFQKDLFSSFSSYLSFFCTLLKKKGKKQIYIKYEVVDASRSPQHFFFFKTYSQHKFSSNLFTSYFSALKVSVVIHRS